MAKYRVLEKSFVNNTLVEAGVEVEFDGEPGPNLQPLSKKRAPAVPESTESGDPGTGEPDQLV